MIASHMQVGETPASRVPLVSVVPLILLPCVAGARMLVYLVSRVRWR